MHLPEPQHYQELLQQKTDQVLQVFAGLPMPAVQVFESPPEYYRMRAEFRLWHEGEQSFFAMFAKEDKKTPIFMTEFAVASRAINDLMPKLLQEIRAAEVLHQRCFQAEFLSTLSGEMLVTLIYHKPLDEQWQAAAEPLAEQLGCQLIGRSRKQKIVIGSEFVTEQLEADGRSFRYVQYEGSFTQPNAQVNQKMISWACQQAASLVSTDAERSDLLELYCGNGNFTLPLARYFNKVLATEISKVSIKALQQNCQLNAVENVQVARMSAEEVSAAIAGVREFRRLKHVELSSYDLNTVFVDPPRAGLDDFTREMVSQYRNIIYISCNPETLARDLQALSVSHQVEQFAFFDQFPYTHHMECGVLLRRC